MIEIRFMLPNSVDKIRVEKKVWRLLVNWESKWVFTVVEETIPFLVEFKFLEESFTGRTCIICQYWIC